jgi:HAD superfamily hydrolase (TIGR01490 family)
MRTATLASLKLAGPVMTLAIFDLDNTLIAGDSDHMWGDFLCDKGLVDSQQFREDNEQFHADYQRGELDIHAYLAFALAPLKGRSPESFQALQNEFIDQRIRPLLLPKADGLLQKHRALGHRLLIITATNEFVTAPIARLLGVETLLGCAVELKNGLITGRAQGTLTYREGKVKRLREWMQEQSEELTGAWFYSDSQNDIPLLELVENPVAVDADPALSALAEQRGWPRLSLR